MSNICKPKPRCFESDIRRLLLAAEAGQKADILAYSSGHLGPRSLKQCQPHKEAKQSDQGTSQSQEEAPNPRTLEKRRTKALAYVKKKEIKQSPSECTSGTSFVKSGILESRQDQATDKSSHADRREDISLPKIAYCSSNSLPVRLRASSQKKSQASSDADESHSDEAGLRDEDQKKMQQEFGRQFTANQYLWAGLNVAEMHERKLERELNKLSPQSWPSRDRLAVFSDVFDDVCESSPVFGRILREIKTDYDLYVNHLMASQSSTLNTLHTSRKDLSNGKVREMELEDAEKEVCRLEEEARRALEENKRVQNELQNIPAIISPEGSDMKNISLSGLQDSNTTIGHANSVQFRRLQVLKVWKEIQQLEEELEEKLVPTVTITATERRIKEQKTQIMKLIASNDRLRTINKALENNINAVLNREKASEATRRMLWDEIYCDLQTKIE